MNSPENVCLRNVVLVAIQGALDVTRCFVKMHSGITLRMTERHRWSGMGESLHICMGQTAWAA